MVATTAVLLLLLQSLCLIAQEPRKRDPTPQDAFEGAGAAKGRIATTTTFETRAADQDAAHDVADEGVAQAAGEDLESGRGELLSADVEGG